MSLMDGLNLGAQLANLIAGAKMGAASDVARIVAASLTVAEALVARGAKVHEVVDAITRIKRIDVGADDREIDAAIARKPAR